MLRPALGPRLHPPHHSYAAIFTLHVYQGKCARKKSWRKEIGSRPFIYRKRQAQLLDEMSLPWELKEEELWSC